ncbi:hypothetical protein AB0Y20_00695 [Heyndrickxia oleronia]|uniref:hypothetical protein n=1 Tax=Heyndrickxia oleronia TaxID=38875 RepID=UPI003F227D54
MGFKEGFLFGLVFGLPIGVIVVAIILLMNAARERYHPFRKENLHERNNEAKPND